jgi:hypothetical protein
MRPSEHRQIVAYSSAASRREFRLALAESAAAWAARGKAWLAGRGQDIEADATRSAQHSEARVAAFARVHKYLRKPAG